MVAPIRKSASEDRKQKQHNNGKLSKRFFSDTLSEACRQEKESENEIQIQTNGYTRGALPFNNHISMREYR